MKSLWVETYRPKSIDNYVWKDPAQRAQVENWIKQKSIPHLLLSGSPGVGKTTLAKVLLNEIGINSFDIMEANGSKEGRKIEWIDKLIAFCQTAPFGLFKVVLIDEADYLNPQSVQPSLRNLTEQYSDTVRFILTCNYPNKIIPPLHSRFQGFHVDKIDHTEFTARCATILVTEGIEFDLDMLDRYVNECYPDLRKCINSLEQGCVDGKLGAPTQAGVVADYLLTASEQFKAGRIAEGRNTIVSNFRADEAEDVFRWLYDNLDIWSDTPEGKDRAIIVIRDGLVNHTLIADAEINLSATLAALAGVNQ